MKERRERTVELGLRLRSLREAFGLVLQDVADLFQTNRNVPSQWENGQREPSYEHLLTLADFYGVTVDWLLGREGAERDSPRVRLVKNHLHDHLRKAEGELIGTTPGERIKAAMDYLVQQDARLFAHDCVARQLLISSEALRQMTEGRALATPFVIQRFAAFVNLPELWFYHPAPQLEDPLVKYRDLVIRIQAEGLTPEDAEQRMWGRRPGRRSK